MTGSSEPVTGGAAVIMQQIKFISDSVVELKDMVMGLDARMRAVEQQEVSSQAVNQIRIDTAHKRLDQVQYDQKEQDERLGMIEHKLPQIDELLKIKDKLIVIVALAGFIGTAVGSLVITLLFDLLTKGL